MPRRALIGPWGHNDPVHGAPGPAVGILGELVRWWDRWLMGIENGIDDEPMLVAYMQDSVAPAANLAERPGRWVAEDEWPSPRIAPSALALGDGTLGEAAPPEATLARSAACRPSAWTAARGAPTRARPTCRSTSGRTTPARSSTTSAPLVEPLEILGFPEARLVLSADRPAALVVGRLCEVRSDGASLLVTRGQLNLCHRGSHAEPEAVAPGRSWTSR